MTLQVFTRSNNDELYDLMRSLIPADIECIKVTGYDHWTQAADYLYHIIDTGIDIVMNVDIDCFIYNWDRVFEWANEFGSFTHLGPRDGGQLPGRYHSWVHMNPFFNIFNAKAIRELKGDTSWEEISKTTYKTQWEYSKPEDLQFPVNNDNAEPFAGLFYWLYQNGYPCFIYGELHPDGISTILSRAMIHTWYSREYNYGHKDRILARYEEARKVKELIDSGINLKQLI